MACPIYKNFGSVDENEKRILSWFPEGTKPARVGILLDVWRDYYCKTSEEFPTDEEREAFLNFKEKRLAEVQMDSAADNITADQWNDLFDVITSLKGTIKENRCRMVAAAFSQELDAFQSKNPNASRAFALNELGGTKALIQKVIDDMSSYSVEDIVEKFSKDYFQGKYGTSVYADLNENGKREADLIRQRLAYVKKHDNSFSILCRRYINEFETAIQVETFTTDEVDEDTDLTETKGKRYTDFRTIDVSETLTDKAKNLLKDIVKTTSDGSIVYDDCGSAVKVPIRQSIQTLVEICWNSDSASFMKDLKSSSTSYPWIGNLVAKLENDEVAQAAMYSATHKARMQYLYVILEDGKYKSKILNTRSAHNSILREAGRNIGATILDSEYTIYDENGNITLGKDVATQRAKGLFSDSSPVGKCIVEYVDVSQDGTGYNGQERYKTGYGQLKSVKTANGRIYPGKVGMQWYLDTFPQEVEKLAGMARGIGIDITADDIRVAAMKPLSESDNKYFKGRYHNRFSIISGCVQALYMNLSGKNNNIQKAFIGERKNFEALQRALSLAVYDDLDAKGRDDDIIRQTFITPNLLSEMFVDLRNDRNLNEQQYVEYLKDMYLNHEGFTLDGEATGLLKYIIRGGHGVMNSVTDRARSITISDLSSFNHVTFADMKKQQMATAEYALWRSNGWENRQFVIPVLSDYTVCYTIGLPEIALPYIKKSIRIREGVYDTKAEIVQAMAKEVRIEYNRIRAIEDRIKNGGEDRVKLKTYEEEGLKFQIFPQMNTMGFRQRFEELSKQNDSGVSATQYLEQTVAELLYDNFLKDKARFEEVGAFSSPEFKSSVVTDDFGKVTNVVRDNFWTEFEEFSLQTFYARQQASKLIFSDTSHFKGLLDFEKRAMMAHAPATPLYIPDESKAYEKVVYLKDIKEPSIYQKDYKEMFDALVREKKMSQAQADIAMKDFAKNTPTDGQGFRTLKSWRDIRRGLGKWTDAQETAYNQVMNGVLTPKILNDLDIAPQKLRYSGYQNIAAETTGTAGITQSSVKTPVLHKYSEQILLPWKAVANSGMAEGGNTPMMALARVVDELGDNAPDLFLFESGCKVGSHDVVNPWAKTDDKGNVLEKYTTVDQISGAVKQHITGNPNATQRLHLKGLGEAAIIDVATKDSKIHIASQAEKMVFGNISDNDMVNVPGVGMMKAVDARKLYDDVSAATVVEDWQKLCDELGNASVARQILLREMNSMPYVSDETRLALTKVSNYDNQIPLFSPQIQHEVQAMLLSIMRKRMTKHKAPGARLVQRTSLGWDVCAASFQSNKGLSDKDKLKIKFEGDGDNKRLAYVEAYGPIPDSRLEVFADERGEISAERLKDLIDRGIIPESLTYAVAYRTPSDAEHSVIPIKFKGFLSRASGKGLILPEDIMKFTGHDFDGDEMPVHYKHFEQDKPNKIIREEFQEALLNPGEAEFSENVKSLIENGQMDDAFKAFKKEALSKDKDKYYKVHEIKYDYSKTALENTQFARDNAKVDLIFSQLSSPAGSRRVIIPGGFEETKRAIKTNRLLHLAKTNETLRNHLFELAGVNPKEGYGALYVAMRGLVWDKARKMYVEPKDKTGVKEAISSYELDGLLSTYGSMESPFSARHEVDSFGYMIETANMIGVFAKFLSTFQMLQKSDAKYNSFKYTKGDDEIVVPTTLFNQNFDDKKLFQIQDVSGDNMASRVLSRLINAAVDNGKDPILGFVGMCTEIAPTVAFMSALGMTEDQIYLFISQPAVAEVLSHMTVARKSLSDSIDDILVTLGSNEDKESEQFFGFGTAHDIIAEKSEIDYADAMMRTFDEVISSQDLDVIDFQRAVLKTMKQIGGAVSDLETFVSAIARPESTSGGTAATIGDTQARILAADDCKKRIKEGDFRIGGLDNMVKNLEIFDGISSEAVLERVKDSPIPQYTLTGELELQYSQILLQRWFPQSRPTWRKVAEQIYGMYGRKKSRKGVLDTVHREQILWKLLSTPEYSDNFNVLREHMLVEVPNALQKLKNDIYQNKKNRRTRDAARKELEKLLQKQEETGTAVDPARKKLLEQASNIPVDSELTVLEQNSFIQNLRVYSGDGMMKPRISFQSGGLDITKLSDVFRTEWSVLTDYSDNISQIAQDLVEYSLFINGFGFGKYEFGTLASYDLIRKANGGRMLRALNKVASSDFDDNEDIKRFIGQYVQNHWDDDRLVAPIDSMALPEEMRAKVATLFRKEKIDKGRGVDIVDTKKLKAGKYYLLKLGKESKLVQYMGKDAADPFVEYSKLSTRKKNGLTSEEFDPKTDPIEMRPYQVMSQKEELSLADVDGTSNFTEAPVQDSAAIASLTMSDAPRGMVRASNRGMALVQGGASTKTAEIKTRIAMAQEAEKNIKANDEAVKLDAAYNAADLALENPLQPAGEEVQQSIEDEAKSNASMDELMAQRIAGTRKTGKKHGSLLNVARISDGKVITEKVENTPANVKTARKQKAYVDLNNRLKTMFERVGVGTGTLSAEEIIAYAEEGLSVYGIADFDTANVLANGLREMIRVAEGQKGQEVLPEEFAHLAVAMLGYEHPLVQRLFNALKLDENAMREAFDGNYDVYQTIYEKKYGDKWQDMMVEEAAGKLIAKKMLQETEIRSTGIRGLVHRIVEAIKNLFRKITSRSVEDAIFDAETEASNFARELLSGRLLDAMDIDHISSGNLYSATKKDLSHASGVLESLIKLETKRLQIFDKRLGSDKRKMKGSESFTATQSNLRNLKRALVTHKTEAAVLKYMQDTLEFLQRTEIRLDDMISQGKSMNQIAGQLNLIRDTLYSNLDAIKAIQEALRDGKISGASGDLQTNINSLSGIISEFFAKYRKISTTLLEEMLKEVYGEDGVTVTVGKDRGRHISIHEMATMGEATKVGSAASHLFNSMADQNDYVLMAFDSVVRKAKFNSRKVQEGFARRIASAVEELHKATGSLDQRFMFELDENGNKTGKYITGEAVDRLTSAQRKFYDTMMEIKSQADKYIPQYKVKKNGIIAIRKTKLQQLKDTEGLAGKFMALKDRFTNMKDTYEMEMNETEKAFVDFEGNRVDVLPIKYINKGPKESWDVMTDDVASSMMAYVGMATDYSEMHKVINTLENARFASMERDIIQRNGNRTPLEKVDYAGVEYTDVYTVKQTKTAIQDCLNDFMSMHVYGHLRRSGYIQLLGHKIPTAAITDFISGITSYTQMGFNLQQRVSNITTGAAQIFIQTAGKDTFSVSDVTWASNIYAKESADRIAETGADESHNKLSLFNEHFDIGQRYNNESNQKKYGKSRFSKIFNTSLLFKGLELGEDYLASTTGLAVAKNTKVKLNGKEVNLWDAYDVAYLDNENKKGAYLKLKNGVTKLDGSAFTQADELAFSKKCAGINFNLQGIYNTDDRAAIQQYPLGALVIMYRKWIAPSLKRRYAGIISGKSKYNELLGKEEMGYHATSLHLAGDILENIIVQGEGIKNSILINWGKMTDYEKSNVKKSATEFAILAGILTCLGMLDTLPPDDEGDEKTGTWRDNFIVYQMLRLKNEIGSQAPTPMLVQEATKILSSPMASIRVIDNALKGLNLLNPANYGEDAIIKSGRFKGHTKAYKYFWSLPILSMRRSVENFVDPEPLINYYKN